jgi:hypothetical protein
MQKNDSKNWGSISDFIQLLFRPNGPSVILQAQRAVSGSSGPTGRHNGCRGTKSPGCWPPNSSSGPTGRQWLFRPSGPTQWMPGDEGPPVAGPPTLPQAQRADSDSSGPTGRHNGCRGTKVPGCWPPNSSSGQTGRQWLFRPSGPTVSWFMPSTDHLEKIIMSALRAFLTEGANEPWLYEPRQPL